MTFRKEKVASLLKKILSDFFVKIFPGDCIVTVTEVDIAKDMGFAKIFVSVYPEKESEGVLKILRKKKGEIKKHVGSKTRLKFIPSFEFEIDKGEKNRQRIAEILGVVAK